MGNNMKLLSKYKTGDVVEVKYYDPRNNYKSEWRDGVVVSIGWVSPCRGGSPYPILFVRIIRSYWDTTKEQFYDKPNVEGFLCWHHVRTQGV